MERGSFEKLCDWLLVATVGVLGVLFGVGILLSPFCSGWNEGSMAGTCTILPLDFLYNAVNGFALIFAFTGILWGPVALFCAVISVMRKIGRYARGGWPTSTSERIKEMLRWVPLAFLAFGVFYIFVL